MDVKALLQILHTTEHLKDVTRHAYTSGGRHESVAEHSWRLCLMAFFLRDEFPELDMDKVDEIRRQLPILSARRKDLYELREI